MKPKIFHWKLHFILLRSNVMSKQILSKTVNTNLKSVLSILILNGYYLHHSHCNLCNSPIGNFVDSKPHNRYAFSIWIQSLSEKEARAMGESRTSALMGKSTIADRFLKHASTSCSQPLLPFPCIWKEARKYCQRFNPPSQRKALIEGDRGDFQLRFCIQNRICV